MGRYIIHLNRSRARSEARAGGKGASLARLLENGFAVPAGFVLTPRAFQAFLDAFSVSEIAQIKHWTESELLLIRNWFRECELPRHLHLAIARAYRKLGGPVAVRSSMVGEDAQEASFAGQLETTLSVEGEDAVAGAVKQCWGSLFSRRLVAYVREHPQANLSEIGDTFALAVVVQRMVPARAAGVAFSVNPLTGEPCVVIEAVEGLGDALVAGRVDPDRYVICPDNSVLETVLADPARRVLPATTLPELADLIRRVHRAAGQPQDVEWAWDGQDYYLLQSRPITSLAGKRVYTSGMVSEMLPGLIKPLVWSISTRSKLESVLGRVFTELIGPAEIDYASLAKPIHSRIYADSTVLGELLARMGLPPNFFEMMSRDETAAQHGPPPINLRTLRTMFRIGRFVWRYGRIVPETESYLERHTQALEPYRESNWSQTAPTDLLARVSELHRLYSESLWMNFIGPLNMMLRNLLLGHLLKLWAPSVVASDLVRGLQGLKSLQSDRALRRLASQATALGDDVVSLLSMGDDLALRASLSATAEGRAMLEALDDFLDDFGFLSAIGTDLSRPSWAEQPSAIWQSIARYTRAPAPLDSEEIGKLREDKHREALSPMSGWQRWIFGRILASTVVHINLREKTSFLISQDSFQLRRVFLALADRLVDLGRLEQRDDIFYLRFDEVESLVGGQLQEPEACERVSRRRSEMQADAEIDLPDTIYGDYVASRQILLAADQTFLCGIVGSSGMAEGRARVVLDPAEAPSSLSKSDILVVPFTDVSWTPLFVGVGGIVAETGGMLSHSAIIARELGLPAVVNVKHATRLIGNGQRVVLDGSQGRVYLH